MPQPHIADLRFELVQDFVQQRVGSLFVHDESLIRFCLRQPV
jgi:hypothetical protein